MSTTQGPDRHTDGSVGRYCVRVLGGSLQLDFPDRIIEPPRAPALVGPLILLALNPKRELAIEVFKAQLYDTDPALVSTATIQTPISRLRSAGLPIPPRVYLLDVAPSDVDIVDFNTRAKDFIDQAVNPDRFSDGEAAPLVERGFDLHHLWQHDPGDAVGNQPRLSALFEPHRRRNRRFGALFVRLLIRSGERERAEDILDQYVDRYGTDEVFEDLERMLRVPRSPVNGSRLDAGITLPGPVAEGAALAELRDRLAASVGLTFAELAIGAHNLDRIYNVDRVAVDHEARIRQVPVEAPGGAAANTAFALARLGHRVAASGIVADDRYGTLLVQSLVQEEVDCTNLLVVPRSNVARTGHTLIFTDPQGGRSAFVEAGLNESFAVALRDDKPSRERLADASMSARLVNFSSFTGDAERRLQEEILAELPEEAVVGFDPGALYAHLGLDRLAAFVLRCDVLYVYEGRLREILTNSSAETSDAYSFRGTVEALFRWRAARVERPLVVVVKRERQVEEKSTEGYEMITIAVGRNTVEDFVSAHARGSLAPIVGDITGQGDAIAAAVHLGLLSGAPLDECADLAFVFANEANSEIGARNGLPRRSTIAAAWEKYFAGVDLPVWVPRS
ncbi:MAG TPA: PfkB family carbohydrate kinase [Acidimicrobiales bacterium]|jgi:sugar/nucleoside kinase (ribokinase family)